MPSLICPGIEAAVRLQALNRCAMSPNRTLQDTPRAGTLFFLGLTGQMHQIVALAGYPCSIVDGDRFLGLCDVAQQTATQPLE